MNTIANIKLAAQTATATVAALHPFGAILWDLLDLLDHCKREVPGQRAYFKGLRDYLFDSHCEWWQEHCADSAPENRELPANKRRAA